MSRDRFVCIEHVIPASHIRQFSRATSTTQEADLQLAIKQYRPLQRPPQPGDVTILACHSNGSPRELYEPMWDALFDYSQQPNAKFGIRGIWCMDVVNHGESARLNTGKIGNEPSWHDFARDYLQMVNHFRHDIPRPIVGFGHSMGGTVIMDLALMHPRLMTSIVTFEPSAARSQAGGSWPGAASITSRRDKWPSRQAAVDHFSKSPVHRQWDSKVLELYLEHGLIDLPAEAEREPGPAALKTPKHQEAVNFARAAWPKFRDQQPTSETVQFDRQSHPEAIAVPNAPGNPMYRPEMTKTFEQLPSLRPSCLYVYGSKSVFSSSKPEKRREKLQATGVGSGGSGGVEEGRVKESEIEGGTHWAPFEKPAEVAGQMGIWLDQEIELWRVSEEAESQAWEGVPVEQRSMVDDDWVYWMDRLFRHKGAKDGTFKASRSKL
ncbi:toxin biosynthesis protein [Teratosphaeria destructans]|uniref:Toxin biosynthesis protein n=1 Tax=Teratosphaeria destructans TaxID=418781 RepID=A0A9W7W370_9PEZI|nr:toxin biosynthesis protein [Teratosphaeria destructans]